MTARRISGWILAFDLIWAALAFVVSVGIRYGFDWTRMIRPSVPALLPFFLATCVMWTLLSGSLKLDGFQGGWRLPAVVSHLVAALLCTTSILLALAYLARNYVSRLVLLYFGLLLLAGFISIRCIAYLILRAKCRQRGVWRVVVLGTGRLAHELAQKFEDHPETLCSVAGLLFPQESSAEDLEFARANPSSVTLSTFDVADYLRERRIDEVILASNVANPEFRNIVDRCRECGIRISVVPQLYELYVTRPRLLDLDGLPVLQLREPHASFGYLTSKRLLDILFASLLAVPAVVLVVPAGLCVLLHGHRFLRRELRCGEQGKLFFMLRLDIDRPTRSSSWFESVLEASSLTELPQLWNVFCGEMSLVGPRPEPPDRVQNYSEWQHRRLRVTPGMTGLAQVHGLRDRSSSEEKTKLDLQYLMHRSLLMDLSLLLQTAWTLTVRLIRGPHNSAQITDSASADSNLNSKEVLFSAHRSQPGTD
jgi:lipopolysaccharide/colanic/teichoic acid biosynthesis glycosyltransferase